MNIDVSPLKHAQWLKIALAQRKRALTVYTQTYGVEGAAQSEMSEEIAQIETAIAASVKAAAKGPHTSQQK